MQAMIRRMLSLTVLLLLAACGGVGDRYNPWSESASGTSAPAVQAPSTILDRTGTSSMAAIPTPYAGQDMATAGEDFGYQDYYAPPLAAAPPARPVKVALLVPLSGPQAGIGQAILQAAQLALFDMGSDSFELMPRDTGDTPQGAKTAAQESINAGAQLILGPLLSSSARAAQPVAQAGGINMVSFSTDWSLASRGTYIMGFLPFEQVRRIGEYAAMKGYRRIGILAPDTEYGNAVVSAYRSWASQAGVSQASVTKYPPRASQGELSSIVGRFARYEERKSSTDDTVAPPPYDAVLIAAGGDEARNIAGLLTFYEMDPDSVRRLGTGLWDDSGLAAEADMRGALFAAPSPDLRSGFEGRYLDSYGQAPPRLASIGYDAAALAIVLARSGQQSQGNPAFDAASLGNPNGFSGIDGIFRFRPDGLSERGLAVLEFRDSGIAVADPAPRTFQLMLGQ